MTPPQYVMNDQVSSTWGHCHFSNDCGMNKPSKKRRLSPRGRYVCEWEDARDVTASKLPLTCGAIQICLRHLGRTVGSKEKRIQVLQELLAYLQQETTLSSAVVMLETSVLVKCARPIQNAVLLHMGYTLSTMKTQQNRVAPQQDDNIHDRKQDISLSLLSQCLYQLYKYAHACHRSNMDVLLNVVEYKELLGLLAQILDRQSSCKDKTTIQACLGIALLLSMSSTHSHTFAQEETILTSLVRLVSGTAHSEQDEMSNDAVRILKALSHQEPQSNATTVYTAVRIFISIHKRNSNHETPREGINGKLYVIGCALYSGKDDKINWEELMGASTAKQCDFILFIRCLSLSPEIARRLAGCLGLLDFLHQNALERNKKDGQLSIDASECLSCIADHCGVCYSMEMLSVLTSTACVAPQLTARRKALYGLYCSVLHGNNVGSLLTQLSSNETNVSFEQLLNSLEASVIENSVTEFEMMQLTANTAYLIKQIEIYTFHSDGYKREYKIVLDTLASLLYSHDPNIVHVAVDTLCERTKDPSLRRSLAKEGNVLTSLSHVISSEFTLIEDKHNAVEVLCNLALEPANLLVLVRNPSVVDALVKAASTTGGNNNNTREPIRRCAVQLLIKLSNLVCNQRVLARQTGLLACLIRFVRSLPQDDEDFDKDKIKDRILKLAVLL